MRVLFSSTSGYGHIFPMVPLARAFAARGHQVLWATGEAARSLPAAAGIETAPAGVSGDALAALRRQIREGSVGIPPQEMPAFVFPRLFGAGLTPGMLADLLPLARNWQPDLLVHEQGELAAPLVSALTGVPSVTHSFGGAVPAPLLEAAAALLAPLWADYGQEIPPYAGCFESAYLDICPPSVQSVPIAHVPVVQGLRPESYTGEPAGLPACVDGGPLVYVTLGTVMNDASVLRTMVAGLATVGVPLLVTVGPDNDPAALGGQPSHVTVERYVSQAQLLPHCTAVVSHGGSGTFLGALEQALPQVLLPQAADQFRNAAGALQSGVAIVLRPNEATPEAVADALRRILAEDSFRQAARVVADDIAAMPSPAEVVEVLELLV